MRQLYRSDVVPKTLSAIVIALMLWARRAAGSFMQEQQTWEALTKIGVLALPAAVVPWLGGRLDDRVRFPVGFLGVVAGYWAIGQPLFVATYSRVLFNDRLLPYLGGAAAVLGLIVVVVRNPSAHRAVPWVPSIALAAALAWTLFAVIPIRAISSIKPGDMAMPSLAVTETYLFEAADETGLAGYASDEVMVICGPKEVLLRFSDGYEKTVKLDLNVESLDIVEGNDKVFVFDKQAGTLYAFDARGELAWTANGLGSVEQAKWSDASGWFLDHPGGSEFDVANSVVHLTRVDLESGDRSTWGLKPPDGLFWTDISDVVTWGWSGVQLGLTGDSAFIRMEVRSDPNAVMRPFSVFAAIPQEEPPGSWCLTRIPEGIDTDVTGVAGETVVKLSFRNDEHEVVARDIWSGEEVWSLVIGGRSRKGKPILVLPDRVLLDWECLHSWKTGLVCLDPRTGQEIWRYDRPRGYLFSMEAVGSKTLLVSQANPPGDNSKTMVTLLGEDGTPEWSYLADSPTFVGRIDIEDGRLTLVEGASSTASAHWGMETVLRLSDGLPEAPSGEESRVMDLGNYRYLILDNVLYRSEDRFRGDYSKNRPVMRLEGPEVRFRDVARYTDRVLARPGFVAVACRTAQGVKVYVLRPTGSQGL